MFRSLQNRIPPNAALLIDAVGCLLAAALLVLSTTVWGWTDLPANWRQPVLVALFVFSVLLVVATQYQTKSLIALAVIGNIAWIIGGSIALVVTGSVLGAIIISAVMFADAIMAWFQAQGLRGSSVEHAT